MRNSPSSSTIPSRIFRLIGKWASQEYFLTDCRGVGAAVMRIPVGRIGRRQMRNEARLASWM
ncbi:hypothetical protein UU5_17697 [Rhodanobacter sp. 115]|nr:hypothetical protein UU5_17697 [Rhodanobacter sp. 115]